MAKSEEMPDLPDLEQFRQRIEAAAEATEEFAAAVGQATTQQAQAPAQGQPQDTGRQDIVNALHLIHDEAVAIRNLLETLIA